MTVRPRSRPHGLIDNFCNDLLAALVVVVGDHDDRENAPENQNNLPDFHARPTLLEKTPLNDLNELLVLTSLPMATL